jgi:sugar/nucleoside kinase (ribokinase family)
VSRAPVLCVGILVADVFVPPLARLPEPGELIATEDFLLQPGGCAANTAIALRTLGVDVAVCGRVGDDLLGSFVEQDLRSRGIDTSGIRRTEGLGTSKTVIIPVAGDDRRFVHTFGANAALTAGDIDTAAFEAAEVLCVGGYLVLPSLREDGLADRLRAARDHGTRVVLDVAVPVGASLSLDVAAEVLPFVDYFVPNEDEGLALTGERDPRRQADRFLECGAGCVAITLGDRGVYVRRGDWELDVEAPPMEVVEPSGAGDAFAAGLVVGILEGWELERSIRFAAVLGASACTALGCYAGVLTREEAEAFLAAHPHA